MWKWTIFWSLPILLVACLSYAEVPERLRWITMSSDSRDVVHEIIRSEVDSRQAFSSLQEERASQKEVEHEKEVEDREYQSAVVAAANEFTRAKKRMDEVTAQFQSSSNELEESLKRVQNTRAGIENLESEIGRYEQDRLLQNQALKKWLQAEKHGEVLVAVVYTRGFKDSAYELEGAADKASAPLIAQHMGSYLISFSRVIDHVMDKDFVRSIEQGSFKWNNEEPLRLELSKNERGTTYLRLKRYELYPFQDTPRSGTTAGGGAQALAALNVAIIDSRQKLHSFLALNGGSNLAEWGRVEALIQSTAQGNAIAEEGLKEQVKMFNDRISALEKRIAGAREDLETQKQQLRRREGDYHRITTEVAAIRGRKEMAEKQFLDAQSTLNDRKRSHESIIIKTAVVNLKGSQSPAEASAEAIMDKLAEVRNDAKTQHSSTTTEVTDARLTAEQTVQSISEARIVGVRLISFVNEGESVRVKMAFRVKTVLETQNESRPERSAERGQKVKAGSVKVTPEPEPEPEEKRAPLLEPDEPEPQPKPTPVVVSLPGSDAAEEVGKPLRPASGGGFKFMLRKVELATDGLHLLVEAKNWDEAPWKVAFYDNNFGSWTKSSVQDAAGNEHYVAEAFLRHGEERIMPGNLDRKGRVEVAPQESVIMELVFDSCRKPGDSLKIKLHPFVYRKGFLRDRWEEFDFDYLYQFPQKTAARAAAARPDGEAAQAASPSGIIPEKGKGQHRKR